MKIFKHRHDFQVPTLSEIWEQVHREIFMDGKMEAVIPIKCKCGKIDFKRINVKLNLEE